MLLGLMLAAALAGPVQDARVIVQQSIEAIGGEAALRRLQVSRISGIRRRNALEQSTRPTGPWLEEVQDTVETRWLDRMSLEDKTRSRGMSSYGPNTAAWSEADIVVSGGRAGRRTDAGFAPAGSAPVQAAEESLALGPERVLLTALDASDLHLAPSEPINGFPHLVVAFTWRGDPAKVYIDPSSRTPSAVDIIRPRPFDVYWAPWGDVESRVDWDVWNLEAGGIRYPHLWSIVSNGLPEANFFIDRVELSIALPPPGAMQVPPPRPIAELPFPADGALVALAPGIHQRPGAWNVLEIDQGGETYIVEGPISDSYSKSEIDRVRASGRNIAGVVTTSDAWPHIGGLREYAADGIPIWALDLNRPILTRLTDAPHLTRPDDLVRSGRKPRWRFISSRTVVGLGPNRFELIPLRTATGERQMAVWFPEHKLLYTSDLFQFSPDGSVFLPGTVQEMAEVVSREKLNVLTVVGMHYPATAWSDVLKRSGLAPKA